jgi:hypothetical protein
VSRAVAHRSASIGKIFEPHRRESNTGFIAGGSVALSRQHFVFQPSQAYFRLRHCIVMLLLIPKIG